MGVGNKGEQGESPKEVMPDSMVFGKVVLLLLVTIGPAHAASACGRGAGPLAFTAVLSRLVETKVVL